MADPRFRVVCTPDALDGAPAGWTSEVLTEGELALLAGAGGLEALDAVAHELGFLTVNLLRREPDAATQEATAMAYAAQLPTVWVAPSFGDAARTWARERGPMTLLVEAEGRLSDEDRRRIERFLAILVPQSE